MTAKGGSAARADTFLLVRPFAPNRRTTIESRPSRYVRRHFIPSSRFLSLSPSLALPPRLLSSSRARSTWIFIPRLRALPSFLHLESGEYLYSTFLFSHARSDVTHGGSYPAPSRLSAPLRVLSISSVLRSVRSTFRSTQILSSSSFTRSSFIIPFVISALLCVCVCV